MPTDNIDIDNTMCPLPNAPQYIDKNSKLEIFMDYYFYEEKIGARRPELFRCAIQVCIENLGTSFLLQSLLSFPRR